MRTLLLAAMVGGIPAAGWAQGPLYKAEVVVAGVTLRAGPSETMPETGNIFRGQKVIVDHELNEGWLAIEAPRGQVSWLNHRYLELPPTAANGQLPFNAVVHSEGEVELATGRPGEGHPLNVRRTKIPNQTIVMIIGQKVQFEGSTWYPIEPTDGDLRYIPKTSVRYLKAQPSQTFVVHSPKTDAKSPELKPVSGGALPVSVPAASSAGRASPNHSLWVQAQQAERSGDYQRAESLYLRLAAEMNQAGGDQELANLCYTQVHAVREKMRNSNRPANQTEQSPESAPARDKSTRWVGPGYLRVAGFRFENRVTYALLDDQSRVICYATNGPGVDLDNFVKREVDLYGSLSFPGELRGVGVLMVTRVQPARR